MPTGPSRVPNSSASHTYDSSGCNSCNTGGGLMLLDSATTLDGVTVSGNEAEAGGGGVYVSEGTASIADSVALLHGALLGPEASQPIPNEPRLVKQLLLFGGDDVTHGFLDRAQKTANIQVRSNVSDSAPVRAFLERLDARLAELPRRLQARATGDLVLLNRTVDSPFFTGPLRSPARLQNTFAHECFMDEVAAAVKADPVEYRIRHLRDPRLREVLTAAAAKSGWPSSVLISRLSRSTIGRAVRAGATIPYHCTASKPGRPPSDSVGRSGAKPTRSRAATPSTLS